MEFDFLKKVFSDVKSGQDFGYFEIVAFKELDIARLYAQFISLENNKSTILLPQNFIHPLFKPFEIKVGTKLKLSEFIQTLVDANYEKVEQVYDEMQFSQKGDVITIFTNLNNSVYKVEFFDNEIEKISLLDSISFRQFKSLKNIVLLNVHPESLDFTPEIYGSFDENNPKIVIYSANNSTFAVDINLEKDLVTKALPLFHKNEKVFEQFISKYTDYEVYYNGHNWEILPESFKKLPQDKELKRLELPIPLDRGFIFENKKVI